MKEQMSYTWFMAYYMYKGKDGRDYFCAVPKRYSVHDNLAHAVCDANMWRLSPCKTRKDAIAACNALNESYRRDGRLATTENMLQEEV